MVAYKLCRELKNGEISPLFINRKSRLPIGVWMDAEKNHSRDGFKYRPFWHCTSKPEASHLSTKGRVWCEIEIEDYEEMVRPENQGGVWYLANRIKIIKKL